MGQPEAGKPFLECSFNDIKRDMDNNYLTAAKLLRDLCSRMTRRREGHIAVVGNHQALTAGLPGSSYTSAGSSALWTLCETIREEVKAFNVSLTYYFAAPALNTHEPHTRLGCAKLLQFILPPLKVSTQAEKLLNGIAKG